MQDEGGNNVKSLTNETRMESELSASRRSSVPDLVENVGTAFSRSMDENSPEAEKTSNTEQDLPKNASSNCETISLHSKDLEDNLSHSDENVEIFNRDTKTTKHFSDPTAIIDDTESSMKVEELANLGDEPCRNFADLSPQENTETAKDFFGTAAAMIEKEKSSTQVEKLENLVDDQRENCKNLLSPRENSWDRRNENGEEASIEDSCEAQPAFISQQNVRSQSNSVQSPRASSSSSSLSEDSRLVKIPLPMSSSMNLIQSNAQFLNKSRNFLNFITEKSTNIMEKTLLPQNIAVRYNSLLKLSEGGYVHEKKHCEVPAGDSTYPAERERAKSVNSLHLRDPENTPRKCSNGFNESSTNSQSPDDVSDSASPGREISSPGINEKSSISCENHEREESSFSEAQVELHSWAVQNDDEEVKLKCSEKDSDKPGQVIQDSSDELLHNPVYLTLVRDYAKVREEKLKLADRVKHLEERNRILEAQNSGELFNAQLEKLEKTVESLSGELRMANANLDELGREYATANKERESMVMKYAVSEKQLIDTQRARDYAERKCKEMAKDHELLQNKLRQAQSERVRICNILDTKCRELTDAQKEVERLKEDVNMRDVKLKWTQNKLKTEMEAQKETQQRLDRATARINDMKEECEQVRRESQDTIRKFQQSEENKAVTLDQQLKEQQARLIVERHVTEDKEMLRIQLQKEVDLLKKRQHALIEENNSLSLKIQDLEKGRLDYASKLSDLKIVADQRQKEIVDLSAKVSHLETLKLQLIHKEQCLASNEAEVERLRQVNQELQTDMDCCRQREAHMLDFTQKLTDKNVRLQSEFTAVEAKAAQLEHEQGPLREGIAELRAKVKMLEESLTDEKRKRIEECEILARHLAEQTQLAQNLTQKLEDSQGEIAVLRRKQQISVREMTRELQQCRKRLEAYESNSPSNSLEPTSRTGSNTSLNTGDTLNGVTPDHNAHGGDHTLMFAELRKEALIDQVLKKQKSNVRLAERNDFLEEHNRTLLAELQKKSKIVQNYVLHGNFDAMGSNETDQYKAELARHGGIMASVYNHRVSDDNMTLQLSLEINQKLQTVLEDTLLKNITLKDSIDTLGEEIARLTIQNQQLLQHQQQQKAK